MRARFPIFNKSTYKYWYTSDLHVNYVAGCGNLSSEIKFAGSVGNITYLEILHFIGY